MAWPDDLAQVRCEGFDRSLLPYLQNAIDNGRVKYVESRMFAESATTTFDYLGFRYELDEFVEVVDAIKKIAKIDEDEHGNEVIVETYGVATTAPQQYESWGCF